MGIWNSDLHWAQLTSSSCLSIIKVGLDYLRLVNVVIWWTGICFEQSNIALVTGFKFWILSSSMYLSPHPRHTQDVLLTFIWLLKGCLNFHVFGDFSQSYYFSLFKLLKLYFNNISPFTFLHLNHPPIYLSQLSFKFTVFLFINCYCTQMCICIYIYIYI